MDNNPHVSDTIDDIDEELPIVVYNEEQSATPNLQHARNPYIYAPNATINLSPQNIPASMGLSNIDVTTPPGLTHEGNQRFEISWETWLSRASFYLTINVGLFALASLKFRIGTESPFQTRLGFIIMPIAAFFVILFTSGIVVYTKNDLKSFMKDHYSPVYDLILKTLLWFSAILTPLSLLLLLFLPHKFNWVGYLIVCAVFVAIFAFNLYSLKRTPPAVGVLEASETV